MKALIDGVIYFGIVLVLSIGACIVIVPIAIGLRYLGDMLLR